MTIYKNNVNNKLKKENKVFGLINNIRIKSNYLGFLKKIRNEKQIFKKRALKKKKKLLIFDTIKGRRHEVELNGYKRFIKTFILKKGKSKKLESLVYKSTLHLAKKLPVLITGPQIKRFFNEYAFPIIYLEKYRIFKKRKSKRPFFKRKALNTLEEQKYIFNFFKEFFFEKLKGNLKNKLQFNFIEMTLKSDQLKDTQTNKIKDSVQKWRRFSLFSKEKKKKYREKKKLKALGISKKKNKILTNFFEEYKELQSEEEFNKDDFIFLNIKKKQVFKEEKFFKSLEHKIGRKLDNINVWRIYQNFWLFKEKKAFNERLLLYNLGKNLLKENNINKIYRGYSIENYFPDRFSLSFLKKKKNDPSFKPEDEKNQVELGFNLVSSKRLFSRKFLSLLDIRSHNFTDLSMITKNAFWGLYKESNKLSSREFLQNKKNSFRYRRKVSFKRKLPKVLNKWDSRKYSFFKRKKRKLKGINSLFLTNYWNVKKIKKQNFLFKKHFSNKKRLNKILFFLEKKCTHLDFDIVQVKKYLRGNTNFQYIRSKLNVKKKKERRAKKYFLPHFYRFMVGRELQSSCYIDDNYTTKINYNEHVDIKRKIFFANHFSKIDKKDVRFFKKIRIQKLSSYFSWKKNFYIKGLLGDENFFKKIAFKKPKYLKNSFFHSSNASFINCSTNFFGYDYFTKNKFCIHVKLKSWSSEHLTSFSEKFKKSIHYKVLQKNGFTIQEKKIDKKLKRETLLTSPHVNKIAQQHFDLTSYQKEFIIHIPKKFLQKKESLSYVINIFNLDTSSIKTKIEFY